jgi:uncharacterized RDD family membrane protein YckC
MADGEDLVYVGFWARAWASVIDTVLLLMIMVPVLFGVYGMGYLETASAGPQGVVDLLVSYLFPAVAVLVFWKYRSATPGKMVIGARIVDARTGGHPTGGQLLGRYLGYFVATIPLGLGLIWVGLDRRKQGWHDKLAGTVVVRPRSAAEPGPARFERPG